MLARTLPAPGIRRRATVTVLALGAVGAAVALGAEPATADDAADSDHEIWALDQGEDLNRIHVHDPDLAEGDVIDFEGHEDDVTTPHMIAFDSSHEYAVVASTASGTVSIIRTDDRAVVETIETGAGAHMASFAPGDESIWVANIHEATFSEITADLDAEEFAVDRELDVLDSEPWLAEFADVEGGGAGARVDGFDEIEEIPDDAESVPTPVCHEYTADGQYAYLTLGPGAGGLVVVDIAADEPEIVEVFERDDVKANCGLARSADGQKIYANWGDPGTPIDGDDPAAGVEEDETGEWYVFDTSDHSLIAASDDVRGVDAHGVRLHPAGDALWQVNRGTGEGVVVDTDTDEIVDEIEDTGGTPDIVDFSPDGEHFYVSLRGPNPISGAAHVAFGENPGFSVLDGETGEPIDTVHPAEEDEDEFERSDFHGLGVRVADPATRIAGADRVATAVAVSRDDFDDGAADGAVLARADDFPDALTGAPLAESVGGPLLLSASNELSAETADELERVLDDATVRLLGGTAALSEQVEADVEALDVDVERHAGATRYQTALEVAAELDDPSTRLIATGEDFPDAIAAGAAAGHTDAAVILTRPEEPPEAVQDYLVENEGEQWAIGGPAAEAHPDAEALVGETRHETALEVAEAFFDDPDFVGLARSDEFPDALAGGPNAAAAGGPVLLTPSSALQDGVGEYVCDTLDVGDTAVAYGGPAALSEDILRAGTARLHGAGCE
ncbi:hypothetical protein ER308_09475 [Egibacter rhizosphaerae]|uniref:Cell wall-binding repeat-containing protein n=1 Tax=Egibacter rhizosphaerae TaxID=1670831 RepID=A0A411YEW4_9ACTN|nr:cell wall-binding repeat-containing protein [Egibacter rhizosphaerae]QBI19758.1 hypothetical protein ER308_09475 [Egibacter rhizosphaerae]